VFVAGATGQIGARITQQLLRSGFNVRGGVRDLYFAQQLAEFSTQYGVSSSTIILMRYDAGRIKPHK
jgi:nucleoside-diphosphate-sugar epimerase